MLRYFIIATFIVLTVAIVATAWSNRDLIRLRIASTNLPVPPKAQDATREGGRGGAPLTGDAPWALSALPDCLYQDSESTGSFAYVRSKLPVSSQVVPPGTTLRYGACTISVGNGEVFVTRGPDRLRIPPDVTLYQAAGELALLRRTGATGELRIYSAARIRVR